MVHLIDSNNGALTTTSKVIADVFEKPHRDVMKAVSSLDCSEEFSMINFSQSEYLTDRGKTYKCYNITEKGFYFLAMGFNGKKAAKWKEAFISEFERLRSGTMNVDQRMTEISNKLGKIKENGKLWSELGREINKSKKEAIKESEKLLSDVQLKLNYDCKDQL
tara:strand:+ start:237 stop:725 length:489 start_codon:yes stop_codon:yes gene_type:complete